MFKIVRFPKNLESFFDSLETPFHWDHFQYFRTLVLLVVIAWRRRNISSLYRHLDSHKSNRNLYKNGRKLKVGGYGYSLFVRHRKKSCRIEKANGPADYTYVDAGWIIAA